MATRSSGPVLNPDIVFPECPKLTTQLPDNETVIGLIKSNFREGNGAVSEREV